MERQSKEESLLLWFFEKGTMKSKSKNNATLNTLCDILDKRFNDYSLTYNEYRADVIDYFENRLNESDDRHTQVADMFAYLINKYSDDGSKKE